MVNQKFCEVIKGRVQKQSSTFYKSKDNARETTIPKIIEQNAVAEHLTEQQ